jgi:hypothetical protein
MLAQSFSLRVWCGFAFVLLETTGCTENHASDAWSSLLNCTLGSEGVKADAAGRQTQLRLLQLSNPGTDGKSDLWPGRCAVHANELFNSLEGSGNQASLRRSLQSKWGCSEGKTTCVINQETLPSLLGELSDGAKTAELKLVPVKTEGATVPSVKFSVEASHWKPILSQPAQLVGPELTAAGEVHFLFKSTGERTRPIACRFLTSGQTLECNTASDKIPLLPPQSIQLVSHPKELIAAGLTEKGLMAFDLKLGDAVAVKGLAGDLHSDGLAVERGDGDKGYVVVSLAKGKASKPIELKSKGTIFQPKSLGSEIVWLESGENSSTLAVRALTGNKLATRANIVGVFNGNVHSCSSGSNTAVGVWGPHEGQRGSKPSLGKDSTSVTIAIRSDGEWSKAFEAKLPFRRTIESELTCTRTGVSIAWAEPSDGGAKVGLLSCDAKGCNTTETTLPGIESRWWWAVGPVGEKVLLMWRAGLGEARMRLAPLDQLNAAKDSVLFDDQDHGGPKAGEAIPVFTDESALLIFKGDQSVVMNILKDGSVKILSRP